MLGNDGGPLKTSPNSVAPIPINNEHFEGKASVVATALLLWWLER